MVVNAAFTRAGSTAASVAERPAGLSVVHQLLRVDTHRAVEFVDVTDLVGDTVRQSGLDDGMVVVHTRHTTTGILVNEHEPLLFEDLARLYAGLAPPGGYAHDDFARRTVNLVPDERRNGHAHCRAALLGTSEVVPVCGGHLALGRWQRVFFVEFDGGQPRQLMLTMVGAWR
jgi:secondary thiamine-phosphate synthase enzyme